MRGLAWTPGCTHFKSAAAALLRPGNVEVVAAHAELAAFAEEMLGTKTA